LEQIWSQGLTIESQNLTRVNHKVCYNVGPQSRVWKKYIMKLLGSMHQNWIFNGVYCYAFFVLFFVNP